MSVGDVLLLGGYQRNSLPEGFLGGLKRLLRLFDIYPWCFGVHPLDVPGHIQPAGGDITSFSPC